MRLVESGKDYIRAELAVVRRTAADWLARAKPALVLALAAVLLVQASVTVLLTALGLGLGHWLGPAGGMAVAAVIGLGLAGLLGWLAVSRLTGKD